MDQTGSASKTFNKLNLTLPTQENKKNVKGKELKQHDQNLDYSISVSKHVQLHFLKSLICTRNYNFPVIEVFKFFVSIWAISFGILCNSTFNELIKTE